MGIRLIGLLFVLTLTGSVFAQTRFTYSQYHMGIDARLTVYASSSEIAEKACSAAFERIAALDSIMSDYRQDSELMRLCASAVGREVRVSPELFAVLKRAQNVSRQSEGAFDITVGPLVALWRKARKSGVHPDPAEIAAARKLVGWRNVVLNEQTGSVLLKLAGMKLDLGGIAKGYAADEAQRVLKSHGIESALVEMGGDIVVSKAPPGKKGWVIRVPAAHGATDMPFSNCAISTSGDREQFVIIGGKRYSHVVDPRSGEPLTSRIEVTMIGRDGLTSDSLATAASVLGEEAGRRLVRRYRGARAYIRLVRD